jgi:hypothetical protein
MLGALGAARRAIEGAGVRFHKRGRAVGAVALLGRVGGAGWCWVVLANSGRGRSERRGRRCTALSGGALLSSPPQDTLHQLRGLALCRDMVKPQGLVLDHPHVPRLIVGAWARRAGAVHFSSPELELSPVLRGGEWEPGHRRKRRAGAYRLSLQWTAWAIAWARRCSQRPSPDMRERSQASRRVIRSPS